MAFDRHVRLRVTFEIRGREQGERLDEGLIASKLAVIIRGAFSLFPSDELRIWDGHVGRIQLDRPHRISRVSVERIEEWEPSREEVPA